MNSATIGSATLNGEEFLAQLMETFQGGLDDHSVSCAYLAFLLLLTTLETNSFK